MSDRPTVILKEQMKALARYEITFRQFMVDDDLRDDEFIFPEKYQMTLEDLQAALTNMLEEDPTLGDMDQFWFSPMQANAEAFGIPVDDDPIREEDLPEGFTPDGEAPMEDDNLDLSNSITVDGGFLFDVDNEELDPQLIRGLPLTEEELFSDIWEDMNRLWYDEDDDSRLSELKQIPMFLEEIQLFWKNAGKPVLERAFSVRQMESFIRAFEDDHRVKNASELDLQLCRRFTDELCDKDSITALHLKGYACYGGSRLYECDWEASRDIMIRLYDMTDDAGFANTLGYIYYYGRCNDGVPEYEKAFRMFTVSAANGIYEGAYKLADMYRRGLACKQSQRTARTLYAMVYDDSLKSFAHGAADGSFADAALRMGNVWMDGIGGPKDPESALRFYLQAELASKLRLEVSDFFGNFTVAENIRKALEEAKAQLPEGYLKEYIAAHIPPSFSTWLRRATGRSFPCG